MFYNPLVESGKNPQKYIKYGAEGLERMLGEFFEGKNPQKYIKYGRFDLFLLLCLW